MVAFSKLMLLSSSISRTDGLQVRAAGQQSVSAGKQRRAASAEIGVCSRETWQDCSYDKDPEHFLHAVQHCSFNKVGSLLAIDTDGARSATNHEGSSALHLASKLGREDVVDYLLNEEWNVGLQNTEGSTALHLASACGHTTIVQALLDKDGVDMPDNNSRTALHLASEKGHPQVVKALVDIQKANDICQYLSMTDSNHKTALHLASEKGNLEVVQALVDIAKDMEGSDMSNGHLCQNYLDMEDSKHKTALLLASEKKHLQVVKALVGGKCDLDEGLTYPGILQLLVEKGCRPPNAIDHDGLTALHYAVVVPPGGTVPHNCDFLEKLLNVKGIDVHLATPKTFRPWDGKTALEIATQHEQGVCNQGQQNICADVCRGRLNSNTLNEAISHVNHRAVPIRKISP